MEVQDVFDKNLVRIVEGDLLKIYHFRTRGKIYYMYHIVVLADNGFLEGKSHYREGNKGHYRIQTSMNKDGNIYHQAEIIYSKDLNDFEQRQKEARKLRKSLITKSTTL